MNAHVVGAIFRRNFVSYFSNPTGYVFIFLFTALGSLAAFWPDEFWTANLANLDQLSRWFPFIMLAFIPAITMGIWADERRQGTDELLLTIPAADSDVVCGKYLSAVSIYSVGLVFSLLCNLLVLRQLGEPDLGIFFTTYFGYWLMGLMMLAIGMAASFVTSNLTVAFVLGALFNVPLVFLVWSGSIVKNETLAAFLRRWSISEQFADFSRGVVSISSLSYFVGLTVVALYLCMVLIGRRHWLGGKDGHSLLGHFVVRAAMLVVAIVAIQWFFTNHDAVRVDLSGQRLSSLSPETIKLIQEIDKERPVRIDAFVSVSEDVPESYVPTQLNLLATLREIQAIGGERLTVNLHRVARFSDETARAERQYGIKPQRVQTRVRGARDFQEVMLGLAFSCKDKSVQVPFVGNTLPVEYEIVRSIATVSQKDQKKLGVLTTPALSGAGGDERQAPGQALMEELKKQYEVVQIDCSAPVTEKIDALLAVQPSSLEPSQIDNFIAAVKSGIPTAIFEDPVPFMFDVPGTKQRQQPRGGNPFMQMPPAPKGNIQPLWDLLEVTFNADNIVCQQFWPSPRWRLILKDPEWVFANPASGAREAFNASDVATAGLTNLLLPFPGSIQGLNSAKRTKFTPLISTGGHTETVTTDELLFDDPFGRGRMINPNRTHVVTGVNYTLAARIESKSEAAVNPKMADKDFVDVPAGDKAKAAEPADASKNKPLNVILVADIDMLQSIFFSLRARTDLFDEDLSPQPENVIFALNAIDELAGEKRFIGVRNRRRVFPTLTRIDTLVSEGEVEVAKERESRTKEMEDAKKKASKELMDKVDELQKRPKIDDNTAMIEIETTRDDLQRKLDVLSKKNAQERDQAIHLKEKDQAAKIRDVQDWYKLWSVVLPPLFPLTIALIVFLQRRAAEHEGVAASRLR